MGVGGIAPSTKILYFKSRITKSEVRDLEKLESEVRAGLDSMESAGRALIEIRERKLYRSDFKTFEDYVEQKWKRERTWAYRMCDAANVCENLLPTGNIPSSERQTRVLAKLEPSEQVAVWTEAVKSGDTTAGGSESVRGIEDKSGAEGWRDSARRRTEARRGHEIKLTLW